MRGVLIGSGNVAWHISQALERSGAVEFCQVYSRNLEHARELADKLRHSDAIDSLADIAADADFYLLAVADDALREIAPQLPDHGALTAHTSGSVEMGVLKGNNVGVFYPLQTFTRGGEMDLKSVPMFIEGGGEVSTMELKRLASAISERVYDADSQVRRRMHVAAVFACNFTNYMWSIADGILRRSDGLDLSVLEPLLKETVRKAFDIGPELSQTGPARRGDRRVLVKHAMMLDGAEQEIYELLSKCIMKKYGS